MHELERWATVALPDNNTEHKARILSFGQQRDRLLLRFHYYSTKILITRPCLCRLERRIKGQSSKSANFNQNTAEACVQAAKGLTTLLPEQPDAEYIYRTGPWWAIVHHIMQAIAIFLLEMSYYRTHTKQHNDIELTTYVKKLVRWLYAMRNGNPVAERALQVVLDIMKSSAHFRSEFLDMLAAEGFPQSQQSSPSVMGTNFSLLHQEPQFQPAEWDPLEWENADLGLKSHINNAYFEIPFMASAATSSISTGEQLQSQPSTAFPLDIFSEQDFFPPSREQMHMPSSVYGNPFLTSFDEPNPIYSTRDDQS